MLPAVTVERNWSPPPASPCWRARWGQGLAPNVNSFLLLVLRASLLIPCLKVEPNIHLLSSKQMSKCLAIRRDLFGHWFAPWAYGCRNSHCTSSKVECKTLVSRWSHWIWVRLPVQSTSSLARSSCLNPIPSSTFGFVLCSLLFLCAFNFIASSVCMLAQEFWYCFHLVFYIPWFIIIYNIITKCSMPNIISVVVYIHMFVLVLWSSLIYQIPDLHHACPGPY